MTAIEDRVARLELQMRRALGTSNALQGRPSDATLSISQNDSWLFDDNVDATHPAKLNYVIAANVQRVVSARLSIFLSPYRTYNSLSLSGTGAGTPHAHGFTPSVTTAAIANAHTLRNDAGGGGWSLDDGSSRFVGTLNFDTGATANESAHTHTLSGSSTLGVTEGATGTGITVSFDGVDQTVALGGPFNADVIELDVRAFLAVTQKLKHTIAMQPTGLSHIGAHLRLGVYVTAGQVV